MKEINDIIQAYKLVRKQGRKCALATVVHVEGSSYRRPGARMLVTEDGVLTGAISGGCLEGDALKKALLAISEQRNKLVVYDTTDEDDARFGIQLGCNGIVYILFEPVLEDGSNHPLVLLQKLSSKRQKATLVTLFSMNKGCTRQPGTCVLCQEDGSSLTGLGDNDVENVLLGAGMTTISTETPATVEYLYNNEPYIIFSDFIVPPISLVLFGAGNDAIPLVKMASILGWEITVIDGRPQYATVTRFPDAGKVVVANASQALSYVSTDELTAFVLMTHNYNYDLEIFRQLLQTDITYLGTLGPKKKLLRMLDEVESQGISFTAEQRSKIYGPVGLDIGSETAEEISLSILAEIKAVISARQIQHLRDKQGSVHEPSAFYV